jgi:hypothetical protein
LRFDCNAGKATFTTVPSMKTMLEPRMVAASVQRRWARPHSVVAGLRDRIAPSSQGDLRTFIRLAAIERSSAENKTPPASADGVDAGTPARS